MKFAIGESVGHYTWPDSVVGKRHEFIVREVIDHTFRYTDPTIARRMGRKLLGIDSRVRTKTGNLSDEQMGRRRLFTSFEAYNDNREPNRMTRQGDTYSEAVVMIDKTAMVCDVVPPLEIR